MTSASRAPGEARHELYTQAEADRLARRLRVCRALLWLTALLGVAACVVLCAQVRTLNAMKIQTAVCAVSVFAGWIFFLLLLVRYRPDRAMHRHTVNMLAGEAAPLEGILRPTGETLNIPGGVTVTRWLLDDASAADESGPRSLHAAAGKAALLPVTETPVRVWTVRKFITAYEGPDPDPRQRARGRVRARLSRLSALLPLLLLWGMMSVLVWGFVFNILTDAPRGEKLLIYADTAVTRGEVLADRLEQAENGPCGPGSPIRMVKIHPFAYAMLDSGELRNSDLYIMTAEDISAYRDWLAPLDESFTNGQPETLFELDGEALGIPLWQPGGSGSPLADTFGFADPQHADAAFYLCVGANSPYLESGYTARAAALLLSMR